MVEVNSQSVSIDEQVDRAEAKVLANKAQSDVLHRQWREHLQRLSLLLIVITFYQAQEPMKSCLKDIKAVNGAAAAAAWPENGAAAPPPGTFEPPMSGLDAAKAVAYDNAGAIAGVILVLFLFLFLRLDPPPTDFSHRYYLLASTCLAPILSLHYQRTNYSCVDDQLARWNVEPEEYKRPFPVVLVLHAITSASCWFMHMQARGHVDNVEKVQLLRQDMKAAQETQRSKKKQ